MPVWDLLSLKQAGPQVELRMKIEGVHSGTRNVIDLLRIELDDDAIPEIDKPAPLEVKVVCTMIVSVAFVTFVCLIADRWRHQRAIKYSP